MFPWQQDICLFVTLVPREIDKHTKIQRPVPVYISSVLFVLLAKVHGSSVGAEKPEHWWRSLGTRVSVEKRGRMPEHTFGWIGVD